MELLAAEQEFFPVPECYDVNISFFTDLGELGLG